MILTSHNPYDLNSFSSPVFSSFLPHLLIFLLFHYLVRFGGKSVDGVDEKSVDDHSDRFEKPIRIFLLGFSFL